MKPVKLVIEGINSFTDAQTLDFETAGRSNLFCICGKTGAGKSTIFDSIMLALYGRSGKGNLADVVNLSRDRAAVRLDFTSGGDMYGVERLIRCRAEKNDDGEPTGKRLASSECTLCKNGVPVAKGEDAAAEIERIVGLGFTEFKNVYLLEQGEYAEFLKKPASKQLEAVGKIFSLTRFGDVYKLAGEKKREAETLAESTVRRIEDLGDVSDSACKALKSELNSLKGKSRAMAAELEKRKADIAGMEKTRDIYLAAQEKQKTVIDTAMRLDGARERLKTAEAQAIAFAESGRAAELDSRISALRERLNRLAALSALDGECDAAERDSAEKSAVAKKSAAEAEDKERALERCRAIYSENADAFKAEIGVFLTAAAKVNDPSEVLSGAINTFGGADIAPDRITSVYYELCAEKTKYDELVRAERAAADAEQATGKAVSADLDKTEMYSARIKEAEKELESARAAEKAALDALTEAQIGSHAAAVRAELCDGDTCPVCGGVYHGGGYCGVDLENAKAAAQSAERLRRQKERETAELEKDIDMTKANYARNAAELERRRAELDDVRNKIAATGVEPELYAALIQSLTRAKGLSDKVISSQREINGTEPIIAAARAAADAATKAAVEAAAKAAELSAGLGDMRGKTRGAIADAKKELEAAEREKNGIDERLRAVNAERDAAKAAVATIEEMLAAAKRDCPADVPEFDEDDYKQRREQAERLAKDIAGCDTGIVRKETELGVAEEKLGKRKALDAELGEYNRRADRYKIISDMTKAKAMLNFVATEYIEEFTAAASEILGRLSSGKYSMSYDREGGFTVSDFLNGGKSRKTDTLSGGEMFLASLSVAIAIARAVGRGADNAFFFLDEGFGTLDEELIDTVYGALEELAKSCLVGVISHSNALIDLMPACVEVAEATDVAGSKIIF